MSASFLAMVAVWIALIATVPYSYWVLKSGRRLHILMKCASYLGALTFGWIVGMALLIFTNWKSAIVVLIGASLAVHWSVVRMLEQRNEEKEYETQKAKRMQATLEAQQEMH